MIWIRKFGNRKGDSGSNDRESITSEYADGVKLGRILEGKFRILDNFVELEEYSAKKTGYHSVMRIDTLRQKQSFM